MNMHGMKDEGIVALLLLASVLDVGGIFISQTSFLRVANDDNFTVVCRDEVEGLRITWRNPKGLVLGPKTRPRAETGSFGTSIIFSTPHKVEDTGNYTCSTEKEKRVFELFVEPPLKFTDTAANQTATEKNDFVIKCEVSGGVVSWMVEGGGIIEQNNKFRVIGDGLLVRNVSHNDSRTYICKGVQERTGAVIERKIHFHVKHKPVHPNHPHKHMRQDVLYGYINGTVNLTCLVVANPPAIFEWKVNDKRTKIGHIINESAEVSILQLHIDRNDVFGNYKCIAKNQYGTYEENFTLKKVVKPVPPKTVRLNETTSKAAIFEIVEPERTPEMDLDTRGFSVLYKKIDEEEWKQEEFNITKSDLYILENLEPNTEYELQAATRNVAGQSDYFSKISWKTEPRAAAARLTPSLLYGVGAIILFRNIRLAFWW